MKRLKGFEIFESTLNKHYGHKNKTTPGSRSLYAIETRGSDIVTRDCELQTRTPAGPPVPESLSLDNLATGQAAKSSPRGSADGPLLQRRAYLRSCRASRHHCPDNALATQVCDQRRTSFSVGTRTILAPPTTTQELPIGLWTSPQRVLIDERPIHAVPAITKTEEMH